MQRRLALVGGVTGHIRFRLDVAAAHHTTLRGFTVDESVSTIWVEAGLAGSNNRIDGRGQPQRIQGLLQTVQGERLATEDHREP